ncbi:MAG TPA: GxxExxY protein [Candidatus Cloacimonadota bacterium]|nr:GxxExxY protein [Candidatus Cloacimonadota bacterium]
MSTNTVRHDLIFKEECFKIVGACMAVHNELGSSFLEPVYQEALALEFNKRSIPFSKEHRLEIYYKEALLDKKYYADFLCYDQIVVELKVCSALNDAHLAQALNYLSALKLRMALRVNFGTPRLQWKRVVL